LQSLSLNGGLSELPSNILKLENLKYLNIDNSYFRNIPTLTSLKNLKELSLFHNYITVLPDNLKEFLPDTITHLWFNNNYIKDISKDILEFPHLERVHFNNNILSEESKKILKELESKGCEVYYDK